MALHRAALLLLLAAASTTLVAAQTNAYGVALPAWFPDVVFAALTIVGLVQVRDASAASTEAA